MIRRKWARILIAGVVTLAVLAIAGAGICYYKYQQVQQVAIVQYEPWQWQPSEAVVGVEVRGSLSVKCPWGQSPKQANVVWRSGLTGSDVGVITKERSFWGFDAYKISFKAVPYKNGELESGGRVQISYQGVAPSKVAEEIKTLVLPALSVSEMPLEDEGDELLLAGEVTPPEAIQGGWLWWTIIGVVALGIVAYIFWWRRRGYQDRGLEAWEIAEQELKELQSQVKAHPDMVVPGVIKVSDIVREYLDKRFQWNSTRQTAPEFLRELTRTDSPLNIEHRKRLKKFVNSAELVKFAGEHPEVSMLNDAIGEAFLLVDDTKETAQVDSDVSNDGNTEGRG